MEDKKHICKYCGKEFETGVKLGGHIVGCKLNPKSKEVAKKISQQKIKSNIYDIQCPICGKYKQIRMTLNTFEKGKYTKTCSSECAHKLSAQNTNREELNKKISDGVKRFMQTCSEEDYKRVFGGYRGEIQYKQCAYCGNKFVKKDRGKSVYCSNECMQKARFEKLSAVAKHSNFGGYKPNSIKNHHKGNYMGIHCDSSWELAYVIYCIEHNIKIERCKETRYYEIEGVQKKYFPDFVINDSQIIEIKGLYDETAKIKAKQNPDIKVLLEDDLQDVLQYVTEKYGNKYWEILYEK